ncbi:MAG: hypothetical protein ACK550_06870 [Synechococcaceae cyanobacterium]
MTASLERRIDRFHQAPWWLTWSGWRGVIFPGRGDCGMDPLVIAANQDQDTIEDCETGIDSIDMTAFVCINAASIGGYIAEFGDSKLITS